MQGYYENHRDEMRGTSTFSVRNDRYPPHFHNSIELAYVSEGELNAVINGETYAAGTGSALIVSPYAIHSYFTPVSSFAFFAIIPMEEVPSARPLLTQKAFAACTLQDEDGTLGVLMRMLDTCPKEDTLSIKGLSYALLGLLARRVGLVIAADSDRTAFIRRVIDYLSEHAAAPDIAASAAAAFGYSKSRFSSLFRAHLHCTLPEYVSAVRCRNAARLLRETDLSGAEIASRVGFESLRTFYRAFKYRYDTTPKKYGSTLDGEIR